MLLLGGLQACISLALVVGVVEQGFDEQLQGCIRVQLKGAERRGQLQGVHSKQGF